MVSFLDQIADRILDGNGSDLSGLCVVFPTRRAGVHFRKALGNKTSTPIWAPKILAIQDFIPEINKTESSHRLILLFNLFEVYRKYFPEEKFDQFFPWGEMMLRDFDEIDRNLVDAESLFKDLAGIKDIESIFGFDDEQASHIREFWRCFSESEPGFLKKSFLNTWKALWPVYTEFKANSLKTNSFYEGALLQMTAENIVALMEGVPWKKIIFAGFYALSKAEEIIFKTLIQAEKAEVFWDSDMYYHDDAKQEAGKFLRKNQFTKGKFNWKGNYFKLEPKTIHITGIPLVTGQAKYLGNLLNDSINKHKLDIGKTAVVLPDENILFPVLHSLPSQVSPLNITMGFPLSHTPLAEFILSVIRLQQNIKQKGGLSFRTKDVITLLKHPMMIKATNGLSAGISNKLEKSRSIFVREDYLKSICSSAEEQLFFSKVDSPESAGIYLTEILSLFSDAELSDKDEHEISDEIVSRFYHQLKVINQIIAKNPGILSLPTYWGLVKEIITTEKIPFSSEPLAGLQIMGFLETRVLDFENLYILSANEGILPSNTLKLSFIPHQLRKAYGLATSEEHDAVTAYHFFRLVQRAKNIHLLYNTEIKSIKGGEKSRFLLQIEHELSKIESVNIIKSFVSTPVQKHSPNPIVYTKDTEVMNRLEDYISEKNGNDSFKKRFSASALSTYINCSLQFYFRYIARLHETVEVTAEMDAGPFGDVLHKALKTLYTDTKTLFSLGSGELKKYVSVSVNQAVFSEFNEPSEDLSGKNILLRDVIIELILKVIAVDKQQKDLVVMGLEQNYQGEIEMDANQFVGLHGIIDRIDSRSGIPVIIDYKTGSLKMTVNPAMDKLFSDPENRIMFQLYFYILLFQINNPDTGVKSAIYHLPRIGQGIQYLKKGSLINPVDLLVFSAHLRDLVQEILNPAVPFSQTNELRRCEYCSYKTICHR